MNEELEREAGFGGGFRTYKNLTIDNGADISGTGATGSFVETDFENEQRIKTVYANSFEGVILFSRAVLTFRDKYQTKKKIWESEEFNPLLNKKRDGANALIPIYKLDFNGQRQKTPEGKFLVEYAFYEDLQKGKKEGAKGMDYAYTVVLYILVPTEGEKEVVKLRFRGAGRGNFFKYQQKLWKEFRSKPQEVYTTFASYLEKEYNKYAVSFSPIIQEDGQPKKYPDPIEIENEMTELLESARNKRMILPPPTPQNLLQQEAHVPQIPIAQPDDEIKLQDIPF